MPAAIEDFIAEMVAAHGFSRDSLREVFRQVRVQRDILRAISVPQERKPWRDYRALFVTSERVHNGAKFWERHAQTLARAAQEFGVPAETVVAILGVETGYGKNVGGYRVMDALSTLAFNYPERGEFFRAELEQFLLLTREEGVDPLSVRGSYAGAMGIPQFMASSYRHYGVDFDRDGRRDLWRNEDDAIGSVGNFLKTHGWEPGQPAAAPARLEGDGFRALLKSGTLRGFTLEEFARRGVFPGTADAPAGARANLLALEGTNGAEYWLVFENFKVIEQYNRSDNYAMAVLELGGEIREFRELAAAQQ